MTLDVPRSVVVASLLGCALGAQASESEDLSLAYGDAQTVSIATGSAKPLRRAPAVATVITARDIAASGARDLDEALALVPGLHVSVQAVEYTPAYGMRGLLGSLVNPQVLLLQNGQPMTTAYTGDKGNTWGGLPLDNVSRIEIIRGPGSALYGADAFSGVINIVTKTADELHGSEAGVRAGSFRSAAAWLQHGGALGPFSVAAYLQANRTDGHRRIIEADAASRLDRLFGTHASLAPGPVNAGYKGLDASLDLGLDRWRLRASYRGRRDVGTGAGVNSALDPQTYVNSDRWMADLGWTEPRWERDWALGASLSFQHYHEETPAGLMLFPPGTRIGPNLFPDGMIGGPARWERQLRASAYAIYGGWTGHSLRLGAGHDDIDLYRAETRKNFLLSPTGVPIPSGPVIDYNPIQAHITPTRRTINYAYVQDEWTLAPDWTLTAGLRHDRYSDFGGTTNPRLALVWEAAYNLSVKALYGQAFRAPTFGEGHTNNPVSTGNPNLRPERIRTRELALSWQPRAQLRLDLNAFHYAASDIIRVVTNPPPATGATFQNIGRQRGRGAELEAQWDPNPELRIGGYGAWQRSVDPVTGQDSGYAPHRQLMLRAEARVQGAWWLGGQALQVAGRRRTPGDARPPVKDYSTLDLSLRRSGSDWELALSVRNVFNADAREPSQPNGSLPNDLPMAGRSAHAQLSYRF